MSNDAVYVFDIGNNLMQKFASKKVFNKSKLAERLSLGGNRIRYSTLTEQHCIFSKIYVTHIRDFAIDYSLANHNPISIREKSYILLKGEKLFIDYLDSAFEILYRAYEYSYKKNGFWETSLFYAGYVALLWRDECDADFNLHKKANFDVINEYFLLQNQLEPCIVDSDVDNFM